MKRAEIEKEIENTQAMLDELETVISDLTDTHFHALITNRIYDLPVLEERFRTKRMEARLLRESMLELKSLLEKIEVDMDAAIAESADTVDTPTAIMPWVSQEGQAAAAASQGV